MACTFQLQLSEKLSVAAQPQKNTPQLMPDDSDSRPDGSVSSNIFAFVKGSFVSIVSE